MRAPIVQLRLLVETPAAWVPAIVCALLIGLAWSVDRRDRRGDPLGRAIEWLAGVAGVTIIAWLFHAGQFPWTEGDWREEWTFFYAWKEALTGFSLPYYIATAMQGTERYFANLQAPMMPYVFALGVISVNAFVLLHLMFVCVIGMLGAIALRRELDLGFTPWILFVIVFLLNGHIVAHLSVGHLPWAAYFLIPWMLLSAIRIARGDHSRRTIFIGAAALAGMILIGGWHVFVWSWLFMTLASVVSPQRLIALAKISAIAALLAAPRLAPGVVTFGTGTNTFISGFPTMASLFSALAGEPLRTELLDPWELEAFVGYGGVLILVLGLLPLRNAARSLNALLVPSAALAILSIGNVYAMTLFHLPGFVSERVTTRLIVLPMLWLTLAGVAHADEWWRRMKGSVVIAIAGLLFALFMALPIVLRAQVWQPHAGAVSDPLPMQVLKMMPTEPVYWWAFWLGVTASIATAVKMARRANGHPI